MFSDVIEAAKSSRSTCRGCRRRIEQGEMRFGADEAGFYGDGESYSWFHLRCAAQRLPDRALTALKAEGPTSIPDFAALVDACERAVQKAASRYPYGERAPTGRARCLECREPIEKGELRVAVEREINAGSFVQTGAGYLHPACAVVHLSDPELGEILKRNSSMLSAAEKAELAGMCVAAGKASANAPSATAAPARSKAETTPRPRTDSGEELVLADELIEREDPRGELIVVATELARLGIDDARGPALARRAKELEPAAREAWAKDIGLRKKELTLERGLPSDVEIDLAGKKTRLPTHRWITGYLVYRANGSAMKRLFADPSFERIRSLVLSDSRFDWDGFRDLCASPEVKRLRSLDITVNVGARGVHMLLMATRFEALEHLAIESNYQATPNLQGYENVAGLKALRSLHLRHGSTALMVAKVLSSPLGQRLEEVGVNGWAWPAEIPALPSLRRIRILDGALLPLSAEGLVRASADGRLPGLRRLDLTETKTDVGSLRKLQKAFGERLVVRTPRPRPKRPAAAKKKKAKGSRAKSARPRAPGKTR